MYRWKERKTDADTVRPNQGPQVQAQAQARAAVLCACVWPSKIVSQGMRACVRYVHTYMHSPLVA